MDRNRSIARHVGPCQSHSNLTRVLRLIIAIGLGLMICGSILTSLSIYLGIAPAFDEQLALDAQHILVIHHGQIPTCSSIPNPPQHDCFWPGATRRVFSVDYLTLQGVRSLVWFQLAAQ
jgi:hypothetical protein